MKSLGLICRCYTDGFGKAQDRFTRVWKTEPDRTELLLLDKVLVHMLTNGSIELIGDQWFGVVYKTNEGDEYYVECDRVSDGIIAIYEEVFMGGFRE